MFSNILMTTLTPLSNTNETSCWQNRPFTTIWPEAHEPTSTTRTLDQPKNAEVKKTIKKKKRFRTAFTPYQLHTLERTFYSLKYISPLERKDLAETLKVTEKSIKVWFQNRRMKEKNESSDCSDSTSTAGSWESPPRPPSAASLQDFNVCSVTPATEMDQRYSVTPAPKMGQHYSAAPAPKMSQCYSATPAPEIDQRYSVTSAPKIDQGYSFTPVPDIAKRYSVTPAPEINRRYSAIPAPERDQRYNFTLVPEMDQQYSATRAPEIDQSYSFTPTSEMNQAYTLTVVGDSQSYQFNGITNPVLAKKQYPSQRQNGATTTPPPADSFATDTNAHPTSYYPTLVDYFLGDNCLRESSNVNSTDVQWSANNFDMHFFQ